MKAAVCKVPEYRMFLKYQNYAIEDRICQFESPPLSVLEWSSDCQATLCGDAHHEEGLEVHQDVLHRVPHVREEHDEELVLQVEVKALRVDDDDRDEDDVNDGQCDQGVVEVGFHLWPGDDKLLGLI